MMIGDSSNGTTLGEIESECHYVPCHQQSDDDLATDVTPSEVEPSNENSHDDDHQNFKLGIAFFLMVIVGTANAILNKLVVSTVQTVVILLSRYYSFSFQLTFIHE